MHQVSDTRFKVALAFFALLATVWLTYLFIIQIYDPFGFKELMRYRYSSAKIIQYPVRGSFYDRNGRLLVYSYNLYQVDLDVKSLDTYSKSKNVNPDSIYALAASFLQPYAPTSTWNVLHRIKDANGRSIMMLPRVKESDLHQIMQDFSKSGLPPVRPTFIKSQRNYAQGGTASRLLGLVRANSTNQNAIYTVSGITGLEATMEDDLRGKFGWIQTYKDAHQKELVAMRENEQNATDGLNIELTIDVNLQQILEQELAKGIVKYNSKNAIGLYMDVNTGEIVAMASFSSKEVADNLWQTSNGANMARGLGNLAVTFTYEPGSTFKPFTALTAVEHNLYKPDEIISCKSWKPEGRRHPITDAHPIPDCNLATIIAESANTGISRVAEKMGKQPLYDTLIDFGFGYKTDSGLQGEANGILRHPDNWGKSSLHSISFGQEVTVTPLQLVVAYAALANGGKILRPLIWKRKLDRKGQLVQTNTPFVHRVVSNKRSLDELRKMLRQVVTEGTGKPINLKYLQLAGKTGTAEKVIDGTYSTSKYIASFAGYFPADTPRYAALIIYDETDHEYRHGSMCAAPTFKNVIEQFVSMPDSDVLVTTKKNNNQLVTAPDVTGLPLAKAIKVIEQAGLKYNLQGPTDGLIKQQYPQPGVSFTLDDKAAITLVTQAQVQVDQPDSANVMPNLCGKSVRDARKLAALHHFKLVVKGRGIIANQTIAPGEHFTYNQVCQVEAK